MKKLKALVILAVFVVTVVAVVFAVFSTKAQNEKIAVPSKIQVSQSEMGGVNITWKALDNVDGYQVWRSKDNLDSFKLFKTVKGKNNTSVYDKSGQKHICFYEIRGIRKGATGDNQGDLSKPVISGKPAAKIPVFVYHRFCGEKAWDDMGEGAYLFVEKKEFIKQLDYLAENGYRTIDSDELYRWHEKEIELPKKTVMITMDDGNYSIIKYALPELEKRNMKATVFMMGDKIYDVTDPEPYSDDSYHAMGIDTMEAVQKSYPKMDFQSHTYELHTSIDGHRAVYTKTYDELVKDAEYMRDKYGFTSVAYPFGAYSDDMLKALEETGYKVAFRYGDDGYARRTDDRFIIPRIKIYGGCTIDEFVDWMQ